MAVHRAYEQLDIRQHDLDLKCWDYCSPALTSFNATTGWTLARVDEQTTLPQLQHLLSFNHFSFIVCFSLWIFVPAFTFFFSLLPRFTNVERLATQKYPPIDRPRASEQDPFYIGT